MPLELRVLGTAAGGGLPQWNCSCANCAKARLGEIPSRLQDSVAVTADGRDWYLLNASPDVARQIEATPQLWPRARRGSPIRGVVLTNGDLDHVLGLFLLRERQPLSVYATPEVRAGLEENTMLRTLMRFDGQLVWRTLQPGREIELVAPDQSRSGVLVRPFSAPGKPPLHLVGSVRPSAGDNLGLSLRSHGGARAVYLSATSTLAPVMSEVDGSGLLLLDGTFWSETELPDAGLGTALATDMAHLPVGGVNGSLAQCREVPVGRKLYTHVNNTNPILDPASAERAQLSDAGWEVATDGLRLVL